MPSVQSRAVKPLMRLYTLINSVKHCRVCKRRSNIYGDSGKEGEKGGEVVDLS